MMDENIFIVREEAGKMRLAGTSGVKFQFGTFVLGGKKDITEVSGKARFLLRLGGPLGYSRADAICLRDGSGAEQNSDLLSLSAVLGTG
jgi:hypothetical protein